MWTSRTKQDLIIEVWEKLDCESVGATEIEAIESAVEARFGNGAVESPMAIARLLADEGAELRHAEILALFVRRMTSAPHIEAIRSIPQITDLRTAMAALDYISRTRQRFVTAKDRIALQHLNAELVALRERLSATAANPRAPSSIRSEFLEIAEWLSIFLQSPEIYDRWIKLRLDSADFKSRFPDFDGDKTI